MDIRFKLNPNNPKDAVILDYLDKQYSATEYIKMLLHHVATTNFNNASILFGGNVNISNQGQITSSEVMQGQKDEFDERNSKTDTSIGTQNMPSSDVECPTLPQVADEALKEEFGEFF